MFAPVEEKAVLGGIQRIYRFENSRYGASVICHTASYSSKAGKWELAVLCDGELCYDTPITEGVIAGVIGHLDDDGVQEILAKIANLKEEG